MTKKLMGFAAVAVMAATSIMIGLPGTAGAITIQGTHGDRPGLHRGGSWFEREDLTGGPADTTFNYGDAGDFPLMCDFDGNGVRTPTVVRGNHWFGSDSPDASTADENFFLGNGFGAGDFPLCGDMNGDQQDDPVIFRTSTATWFWRDSPTSGFGEHFYFYGDPGDFPVIGDWHNDGIDTPGVVRGSAWFLRDGADGGLGDSLLFFGNGPNNGDFPVVGDWNNDGSDTAGVFRNGRWLLTDAANGATVSHDFLFGTSGDFPVVYTLGGP